MGNITLAGLALNQENRLWVNAKSKHFSLLPFLLFFL